uniref:Nuclear protein, ataxia-telangiectasia locus n=1 Tax=Labrus bergylta TaxID=56723 RepID=A0A3Q3F7G4_9LABR
MLLPSDVARLVLGYLQDEGLSATSKAFINESPNLKEYADHTTEDGTIPACVFSVFGKGLTTILNEYVAAKTKESSHEVPAMMTSLWKKLDFTLNQIKVTSASAVVCSAVSESSSIVSPSHISHSMLGHSTPVSYSATYVRPTTGSDSHQQIQDDVSRLVATTSQYQKNLQLVIQNARDKILGDRSLQEKLAENINKILGSDATPQTSKPPSSTVEADQSIDEILGLQGEIHMSDDAIHDILEQTESDPAFQALFDLFECSNYDLLYLHFFNMLKSPVSVFFNVTQKEVNNLDQTAIAVKMRAQDQKERKTRKSTAPTLLKKTFIGPSSRSSRIENSSARLLVSHGQHRGGSSAGNSNRKLQASLTNKSDFEKPMDIDGPLNTPPAPLNIMAILEPAPKDSALTTASLSDSTIVTSSRASAAFALPEFTLSSYVDKKQEFKQTQGAKEQPATVCASTFSNPPACLSTVQDEMKNPPTQTSYLPHMSLSSSGGDNQPVFTLSTLESASSTSASSFTTGTTVCALPLLTSTTPLLQETTGSTKSAPALLSPASSASPVPTPSYAPVVAEPDPPSDNHTTPSKAATDSNIVSLKIIISDNQDEHSSSEMVLNQAVSSIPSEKIPTIYLSSPAKSPAGPVLPKANLDEAALAVSGLQSSEGHLSPLSIKGGAVVASPLTGTSQAQPNYIIQLPLDTTNHALQGATASYYLVTDPSSTDAQTGQMLLSTGVSKGQPLPTNQYGVTTPTCTQGFTAGKRSNPFLLWSALILPSPVKPMMLPVSVMGQTTLGAVQVVSNQDVSLPFCSDLVFLIPGTEQHLVGKSVQPVSAETTGQQNTEKASKHRRILCFDSSAEVQKQSAKNTLPPATNRSSAQPVQPTVKEKSHPAMQTKPNILGGNKPKRRVHPVRCSTDPQPGGSFVKEVEMLVTPQQHQKENPGKQGNRQNQESQSASTSRVDESKLEPLKKSDQDRKSQSIDRKHGHDKDGEGATEKNPHRSRSLSSEDPLKSGTIIEKDESSKKELGEKAPAKSREGHTEKRTFSQEVPNVTANKENEIKGSTQGQSTPSSSASKDISSPAVSQATSNPQSKATKPPSKTSSLAKQAAEMLQDIKGQTFPSTPVKRPGVGLSDLNLPPTPVTDLNTDELADCARTPSRQRKGKDKEGTPKHLMPANTPDIPTCSPASEAGSENSINMAAHTLMILSRAAIARTGTPLKDSLRQEGVGENSPTSSKNAKKRKPSSPTASPPAKKDRERKKMMDCFPHDLDVDKFLSSLHYDE